MTQFELDRLNDKQQEAVEHVEGPLLILAGAGSGKTRVITNRVAYLIQRGIDPSHILAVSFTNKAADEMEERVAELTGPELADDAHLSTFHSLGADILRRDIDALGYSRPFTILDQSEKLSVVEDVMSELDLDLDGDEGPSPRQIATIISEAKMECAEPEELNGAKYNRTYFLAQGVYERYVRALRGLNAVDFDDLIRLPIELFREHEDIRIKYGDRFRYVMVDEYQDTNETQLIFLRELVKDHRNLCVVGDDDQSIYGFRGALADNIPRFEDEFEEARVIKLEQNYRSTNNILEAANALIKENPTRKEKELWSDKEAGSEIAWVACENGKEEADYVTAEIERIHAQKRLDWSDFAILYRVNPQSQPFEQALGRQNIPHRVRGATEFFDRREIKDFVAHLKVALNPKDELSLRRIVSAKHGIGPTLLERFSQYASDHDLDLFEALEEIVEDPSRIDRLGYANSKHLRDFVETMRDYHEALLEAEEAGEPTAERVGRLFEESGLKSRIRRREDENHRARQRVENVEELIESLDTFESNSEAGLRGFLEHVTLDQRDPNDEDEDRDAVQLMTIHSAKGLEFPAVFLVGMEEDYLPHRENTRGKDLFEERRLAYVGLTRAERHLTLTSAESRERYGREIEREPSRFLEELPDDIVETDRARDRESMRQQQEERNKEGLDALRDEIFDD
jgi:DNA helicase-2/ATP-dependent DNA helicase PcrA